MVVFEARTGRPVSVNREAKRIVDGLRQPGGSLEDLLEVTTCRRADGREVALDGRSMGGLLRSAETVRAEEVVLQVPGWAPGPDPGQPHPNPFPGRPDRVGGRHPSGS